MTLTDLLIPQRWRGVRFLSANDVVLLTRSQWDHHVASSPNAGAWSGKQYINAFLTHCCTKEAICHCAFNSLLYRKRSMPSRCFQLGNLPVSMASFNSVQHCKVVNNFFYIVALISFGKQELPYVSWILKSNHKLTWVEPISAVSESFVHVYGMWRPCKSNVPFLKPSVFAPYMGSSGERRWPCISMIAFPAYGRSSVPIYATQGTSMFYVALCWTLLQNCAESFFNQIDLEHFFVTVIKNSLKLGKSIFIGTPFSEIQCCSVTFCIMNIMSGVCKSL